MNSTILQGLSLIDRTGLAILATTLATLILAIAASQWLRRRYLALERELEGVNQPERRLSHPVFKHILRDATEASYHWGEPNTQAIIEEHFQRDLRPLLLAERFVRSATGLVIILGLLGTFYGLTLSIGKIVLLVSQEGSAVADVSQGVSQGLTRALSGMAVAFSNSLVGVLSAVILTVLGIVSNAADRRTALMVQIETYLDRLLPAGRAARTSAQTVDRPVESPSGLGEAVDRLDGVVGRFETAMQAFATSTRDFREFNAHLKDNVQRMSLAFADLGDAVKSEVAGLKVDHRG
jgi:hypothetical protein